MPGRSTPTWASAGSTRWGCAWVTCRASGSQRTIRPEDLLEEFRGDGLREQVALAAVALQHGERGQLFRGLNAFCDHAGAQAVRSGDHRGCDRTVDRALRDLGDEAHVELERVDFVGSERRERVVTGSEVVHGDADANGPQLSHDGRVAFDVRAHDRLGELEFE